MFIRERTPRPVILYAVYLVFEGLSPRAAKRAIGPFTKSHVAIWKWIQALSPLEKLFKSRRARCYLVDETRVKVGGLQGWIWIAYEPHQRMLLTLWFSWTRSILTARAFLSMLVRRYGRRPVYTNGASWYPEACRGLRLPHRPLTSRLRSIIDKATQLLKDRTEGFDDYFPCRGRGCKLKHVQNWLRLFTLHQQPRYLRLIGSIEGDNLKLTELTGRVQKFEHGNYSMLCSPRWSMVVASTQLLAQALEEVLPRTIRVGRPRRGRPPKRSIRTYLKLLVVKEAERKPLRRADVELSRGACGERVPKSTIQCWELIGPLLPPRARTGRPRVDDRMVLNSILYVRYRL